MRPGALPTNIFAPIWQGGPQRGDTPEGFRDYAREYPLTITVTNVAPQSFGNTFRLEGGGQFWWNEFNFSAVATGGMTADPMIRVRYPDGTFLSDDWLFCADIVGPLWPAQPLPGGGLLTVDLQIIVLAGAGSLATQISFRGFKRVKQ